MRRYRAIRLGRTGGCLLLFLLIHSAVTAASISTAGVYDETTTQANNVDFNAAFSSGTGGATAANTTTASTGNGAAYSTIGPFNAVLAAAFAADSGGVWNFDTQATGNLPEANVLSYGISQSKTITLTQTNSVTPMFVSSGGPTHDASSISLSNYLDNVNGFSYAFSFSNLTGGLPGETGVMELGFTALSASDPSTGVPINFGTVTGIANFSGGGSVTETATIDSVKGAGDTFFGFIAPSGQTITSFSIASSGPGTGSPDLDDIAFVTNATAVPEPSTALLFISGLGAAPFLRKIRRALQRNPGQ
jgi:hypothetical protein